MISPFTLRAVLDDQGLRFDACTADTEAGRDEIVAAARSSGLRGQANCSVGLGAPSSRWAEAVTTGLGSLVALGGGKITFSDADVTLVGLAGTGQGQFDRVVGELENALPRPSPCTACCPPTRPTPRPCPSSAPPARPKASSSCAAGCPTR